MSLAIPSTSFSPRLVRTFSKPARALAVGIFTNFSGGGSAGVWQHPVTSSTGAIASTTLIKRLGFIGFLLGVARCLHPGAGDVIRDPWLLGAGRIGRVVAVAGRPFPSPPRWNAS